MKKIAFAFILVVTTLFSTAQTKPTKTNVVGKWGIYSVMVPGQLYYNIEKDSLDLSSEMKATIDPAQLPMMTTVLKQQFTMFTKVSFTFNADGSAEFVSPTGESQKGTYMVDEEKGTITNNENGGKEKDVLSKVSILDNGTKMELIANVEAIEIHMVLKKLK